MVSLEKIKKLLYEAGLIPDILVVSGWLYAFILFAFLAVNMLLYMLEFFKNRKNH
ncbi:hypothetical protein SAMN02745134_02999 [Clostridium acidisoli DSM 12555]|uniref:Uncharacterized protein n=1 Tax=Clostridium acidisoli DSM 12555 TaxID=1121291 RepID=A0A1W1XST9_9CLOT|nr:hypothetical protein SAMN02745134_02999 [Clostridium acidisoli DSM 12555]